MKESVEKIYRATSVCRELEQLVQEINDREKQKQEKVRLALANTPTQSRARRIKKYIENYVG